MLISRKWLLAVVAVLLAAGLVLIAIQQNHNREHKLSDGSLLRVEKVSYGKQESFKIGGRLQELKEQLQKRLPKSWSDRLFKSALPMGGSTWYFTTVIHTNNDALRIWLTRRDPDSGSYQSVNIQSAELLDTHGCPFNTTSAGGSDDGRLPPRGTSNRGPQGSVEWLLFEAFPRHEKSFRLRVYDVEGKFLTEFNVPNPAFAPIKTTNWMVEPLPIAKPCQNVTFILTGLKIKTNHHELAHTHPHYHQPFEIDPTFKILEGGAASTQWQALDMELYDSSGNFASKMDPKALFLCPWEAAWKLRVKFFASEESPSASNILWTARGVKIPALGEFIPLDAAESLEGVHVKALALAGPGTVTYSNYIPIKATSDVPSRDGLYPIHNSSIMNGMNGATIETISFKTHHIAMFISTLTQDQRLTIRATDDQGRQFYAQDWQQRFGDNGSKKSGDIHYLESGFSFGRGPAFFKLDLPADSKTVDITFCIHNSSTAEFIFKPPTLEEQPDKSRPDDRPANHP